MLPQSLLGPGRLDLIQMLISVFNGVIGFDNGGRRLLTDGGHARNIVGSVAHQGLHIDKFQRRHPVLGLYILGIIIVNLRLPL